MALTQAYTNTYYILYTENTHTNTHTESEEHTVVDVPTDAERRQIAPFEGTAK